MTKTLGHITFDSFAFAIWNRKPKRKTEWNCGPTHEAKTRPFQFRLKYQHRSTYKCSLTHTHTHSNIGVAKHLHFAPTQFIEREPNTEKRESFPFSISAYERSEMHGYLSFVFCSSFFPLETWINVGKAIIFHIKCVFVIRLLALPLCRYAKSLSQFRC